ncbi:hypothetical protein [Mycobacterium sp. 236(2023)]|uniref:hypothetical protein n=1 Tax=Mycobacterium sp. 236(2023) TaxID=3038163 RepID=UPI0024153A6F|nr:hypothetical protein [Mycobacterium sp. 236(2023)]MDG4668183.1 hypothetical protein [Mycobacterium sp. 236(2023)]
MSWIPPTRTAGAAITVIVAIFVLVVPPAGADDSVALNGHYLAVSDGKWSKTGDRDYDQPTVTNIWTIATVCENFQRCQGEVVSDAGWTATIKLLSGTWYVGPRVHESWAPCPNGTAASGSQQYRFWTDPDNPAILTGWDKTRTASGACGRNRSVEVQMPFHLSPL